MTFAANPAATPDPAVRRQLRVPAKATAHSGLKAAPSHRMRNPLPANGKFLDLLILSVVMNRYSICRKGKYAIGIAGCLGPVRSDDTGDLHMP